MTSKICAAWPSLNSDRVSDTYSEELAEMAGRYGRSVVEQGITAAIRDTGRSNASFAPSATELRGYVSNAATSRREFKRCRLCADYEGWVAVVGPEKKVVPLGELQPNRPDTYRVTRCQHAE